MKRFILTMAAVLVLGAAANATSYKTARDQAFYLTDKMAYELGLSNDQYNAVFEINMDYIMCIENFNDLYGTYWDRRNVELRYVLSTAQYQRYAAVEYFYRPVSWTNNKMVYIVYNHYPKDRYYYAAPPGYQTYKGSNRYFEHSPYNGRSYGQDSKSQPKPGSGGMMPGSNTNKSQPGSNTNKSQPGSSKSQPGLSKKQAVNEGKQRMEQNRRH